MARVTVFNTIGSNETSFNYTGTNWSDLQIELAANNISYKGMSAIVGESQVTLESAQAMTPTDDFTLFLLPIEVKSGVEDDADFGDDYENDADYEAYDAPAVVQPFLSLETQTFIKQLEDAKAVLDVVLTTLRGKVITDPHIIEMQRRAAALMAGRR